MKNFAIISELRSGYQMLTASLNTHPDVLCFGEIFGSDPEVRKKSLWRKPVPIIEANDSPIDYVGVLNKYAASQGKIALGFKLNYVCARQPNWLCLWGHMVEQNWNIIHLQRRNLLDRFMSQLLAETENNWAGKTYSSSLVVSPNHFFKSCDQTYVWRAETQNHFSNTPVLDMFYEDLETTPQVVYREVQSFLGVKVQDLQINTLKQQKRRQSEIVENYRDLLRTTQRFRPELLVHFKEPLVL